MAVHTYGEATYETLDGMFAGGMFRARNVLCPDGIRRNAWPTYDGTADTFFSVPAYVYGKANGRTVRVYGYVSIDSNRSSRDGHELGGNPDVYFHPYRYRMHHDAVCHPLPAFLACMHCGEEVQTIDGRGDIRTSRDPHVTHVHGSFLCDVLAYRAGTNTNHAEYVPTLLPYRNYERDRFVIVSETADGTRAFLHSIDDAGMPYVSGSGMFYASRYTYREARRMMARLAGMDGPYVGSRPWQMVREDDAR